MAEISTEEMVLRVKRTWEETEHWLKNWEDCSAGKWNELESVTVLPVYWKSSPLCRAYYLPDRNFHLYPGLECTHCPITDFTDVPGCQKTPHWGMILDLVRQKKMPEGTRRYDKAAPKVEEMYGFMVEVALEESRSLLDRLNGNEKRGIEDEERKREPGLCDFGQET